MHGRGTNTPGPRSAMGIRWRDGVDAALADDSGVDAVDEW